MLNNIRNYVKQDDLKIIIKDNIIDIVNYFDLGNISDKEIIVFSSNKKIIIKGFNLSINKLLSKEILITGKYDNIIFEAINE